MYSAQKIAIVGLSPINLFLSVFGQKGHNIIFFNSDSWLGGAWRRINTPFGFLPSHNNIILPLSIQENYLKPIQIRFVL